MSRRLQLICAWCGPATVVVTLCGWLIAGILPIPLGASSSTEEVVNFYGHDTRVLAGLVIAQLGICLVFPLIALIGYQMLRIEGRRPLLTLLQLVTGAATGVLLLLPMLLMAVAAFRPDRNPELTVTLNDISWLVFITPIAPFIIQNISIGTAILRDPNQTLPRWVGYMNFWIAASFLPDQLAFFFHGGPFSWRGVFVFWLALTTYSVFLVGMGLVLRAAALRDDDAVSAAHPAAAY
ncbi:hypothetical protein SBI67_23475 [Mycolicibacterium sp. 120266]|jgi:hypothetical protein|uniref:hypothetical protein n=1 Tax=Mycolicibacterium sp. 120266 TaxID=3090601 RepID=UPI00299E953D|nr:hypothetical protein [Mycolicibacterium sp. 120266]MDX1875089.1 hypothetical protein [Mycolicibacterium sp. 120266]